LEGEVIEISDELKCFKAAIKKQAQNLCVKFKMWSVAVEALMRHKGSKNVGTSAHKMKPLKFDRSTPYAAFHYQF
jgi:hypothetical protein